MDKLDIYVVYSDKKLGQDCRPMATFLGFYFIYIYFFMEKWLSCLFCGRYTYCAPCTVLMMVNYTAQYSTYIAWGRWFIIYWKPTYIGAKFNGLWLC
jgi:hypothetical protein